LSRVLAERRSDEATTKRRGDEATKQAARSLLQRDFSRYYIVVQLEKSTSAVLLLSRVGAMRKEGDARTRVTVKRETEEERRGKRRGRHYGRRFSIGVLTVALVPQISKGSYATAMRDIKTKRFTFHRYYL
jgi:hypothetical protein